jgi:hypothetical protein
MAPPQHGLGVELPVRQVGLPRVAHVELVAVIVARGELGRQCLSDVLHVVGVEDGDALLAGLEAVPQVGHEDLVALGQGRVERADVVTRRDVNARYSDFH